SAAATACFDIAGIVAPATPSVDPPLVPWYLSPSADEALLLELIELARVIRHRERRAAGEAELPGDDLDRGGASAGRAAVQRQGRLRRIDGASDQDIAIPTQ